MSLVFIKTKHNITKNMPITNGTVLLENKLSGMYSGIATMDSCETALNMSWKLGVLKGQPQQSQLLIHFDMLMLN